MTASKFTLPKNKSAYAMLPTEIQPLIDFTAEAVLHVPPVTSAVEAVRAAIVAEHRSGDGELECR